MCQDFNPIHLPPLDENSVVLFPEYAVFEGEIYHRSTLLKVENAYVLDLDFKDNIGDFLVSRRLYYISDFINLASDRFLIIFRGSTYSPISTVGVVQRFLEKSLDKAREATPGIAFSETKVQPQERSSENIVQYLPGCEPAMIKLKLLRLFAKLDEVYPDKVIRGHQKDHKKWSEIVTELYRALGYPDGNSMLEAYGYTVEIQRVGRKAQAYVEGFLRELKRRYPNGSDCKTVTALIQENEDLKGHFVFLSKNAPSLFGKNPAEVLREEGILQIAEKALTEPIVRKTKEEKLQEKIEKVETLLLQLKERYPSGFSGSLKKLESENSDLFPLSYQIIIKEIYKTTPKSLFEENGILLSEEQKNAVKSDCSGYAQEEPLDEKPHPIGESNIFSSYSFIDGQLVNMASGMVYKDVPISKIGLNPLAEKALSAWGKKREIFVDGDLMLSSVLQISSDDVKKFRPNTWEKIKQEIQNYLQSAISDFSCDGDSGVSAENMVGEVSPDILENSVEDFSEINLYQLDMDTPVIAEDFVVLNYRIFRKQDQVEVLNAPIQQLNLSHRGENGLLRNRVSFIHQLIGMPVDTFYGLHNLGKKTAFEILEKLDLYLSKNVLLSDAEPIVENQEDAHSKELSKNILRISEVKNEILALFRKLPFIRLSKDDCLLQIYNRKPEDICLALDELVDCAELFCEQGEYFCKYPSFFDILEKYAVTGMDSDKRSYEILNMRMKGKTLDTVGQEFHLTRERVRQIISKFFRMVIKTHEGLFAEDQYAYLYETYWVPKEFLFILTKDDPRTAYYLEFRYEQGSLSLENALEDPRISVPMRREIEKWNYRNYIQIDGQMVPAEREALEQVVLRKFCQAACSVDEFFNRYNQFVSEQPLSEIQLSKVITTAEQRRSRESKLADSECLLWSHNRQLRYYNMRALDFSDLFDALNLEQYQGIELSTLKFFRGYPDLMAKYDIRNEYELHNLLKKLSCEKENSSIHFSKMPTIRFGEFDRDQYVKNLLFELAPISAEDFAAYISEELGFSAMFVRNWFHCIDEYYYQGQFSVDYVAMSEENLALLKGHLDEDFYFFSEIKAIYAELVPNADLSEISTFNLKKLGFDVNGTYVYKNYPSAAVFFNHLYCKSDIVDCNAFYERFRQIVLFNQVRHELEKNYEIVEFEPMQYINIRRLEKLGIGKAQLKAFCDEVYNFVENNTFFTVEYIRNEGFTSSLDDLGFGSLFYASLLKCDPRFPNRNLGKNMMFHSGLRQVSIEAFILDYVKKVQSIDVEELIEVLYDDYSIILDRWKIIEQCDNTELYYDRIMGKIYANYDVYFEEI